MSAAVAKSSQKKLKFEEVLCPICREIYIEPIPLPCKHVVCLQCLEKTVENNSLVCPICRTRIGTFIRLAKNLKKIVDQAFWQTLKNQFPIEIQKKLNGEDDGIEKRALGSALQHTLAERGSIKEEFDEMFHKLKIQEERSRRAELIASEELARQIMEQEMEEERQRKKKEEDLVKSDVLYIKSLIRSENQVVPDYATGNRGMVLEKSLLPERDVPFIKKVQAQRESLHHSEGNVSASSSISNDHDSISDELRHFTPICVAPKTPPKRLPNGKLKDTTIIKPINLSSSFRAVSTRKNIGVLKNKMPLKVRSNNFHRTKPTSVEDIEMDVEADTVNITTSDLNSNITDNLPPEIIKEQELIEQRIKQEQADMAIALKLHNKWNKEKCQVKRKHGYQLRSAKRCKSKI